MKVDVIIPVYRPDEELMKLLAGLQKQTCAVQEIILINTEEPLYLAFRKQHPQLDAILNLRVYHVTKEEFDHAATRALAVAKSSADIFVMMTMDAVPKDETLIAQLLEGFADEQVACCYARQLPKENAGPLEVFQRGFNYPDTDIRKTKEDLSRLGIKTFFCSNVCCAYRREIYDRLGGFTERAIFNEDMIYAHQALTNGYAILYRAEAQVYHSHDYSAWQQFHRNFDLGVSQAMNPQVFANVPSESEGIKSVKQAAAYLRKEKKPYLLPKLIWQSGFKFIGYRLGKCYRKLPKKICLFCTMNKNFWKS